jgi:transcriptional regulator with XRE-family HTH domain
MTLSGTLRALRLKDNLSQAELAQKMGVHRNTVWKMEREPERASLELLGKAAAAYGVDTWKILRYASRHIVQE